MATFEDKPEGDDTLMKWLFHSVKHRSSSDPSQPTTDRFRTQAFIDEQKMKEPNSPPPKSLLTHRRRESEAGKCREEADPCSPRNL